MKKLDLEVSNKPSDGAEPVPNKIGVTGWYVDVNGDVCLPVGLNMVRIHKNGAAALMQLLESNVASADWQVAWEEVCYTHGEMCAMAQRMVNQARIDSRLYGSSII